MKFNKKKQSDTKTSSVTQSSGLLKTLNNAIVSVNNKQEVSLSISYVFVNKKLKNIHAHDPKDLVNEEVKSMLHSRVGAVAIKDKTPQDLVKMFHDIKHDIGADYFVVN